RRAPCKIPDLLGQSAGKCKYALEGDIFPERYQMNLVIACHPFPIRAHQATGVVNLRRLLRRLTGIPDSQTPDKHPRLRLTRDIAYRLTKRRISRVKRSRRLRPHDQVALSRSFTIRCAEADRGQILKSGLEIFFRPIRSFYGWNVLLHQS